MKTKLYIYFFIIIFFTNIKSSNEKNDFEWAIVGGGPAGLITIGVLNDLGVDLSQIAWIDPFFNVGRLGEYYQNVPGNTSNKYFVRLIESCKLFKEVNTQSIQYLYTLPPEEFQELKVIVQPLQDITDYVKPKVNSIVGTMDYLDFYDNKWHLGINQKIISSKHVVLATGSKPKTLDYEINDTIPLDYALDRNLLHQMVKPWDKIAVIGGSHSAVLIMKFLSETNVAKIVNFYKNPITYAVDMGSWILNNTYGLKGVAAIWAKEILEGPNPPKNIFRYYNNEENKRLYLKECNKIVFAIGYEKNQLPNMTINGNDIDITFNEETGVIGPRIFGIGIAFPGSYLDPVGNKEQLVGLNSFMKYAQSVIPNWIKKDKNSRAIAEAQRKIFEQFESLFEIYAL